jgi:hypothetical protein
LTRRQNEFCEAYVATGNAADAARRAGYSERAARFHGHRLLKDARVQARLAALRTALADKIDPGLILGRLENLYRLAERDGGYRAAARILVLIGRMIGVDYNGGAIYLRSPDLQPEPRLPSATEASRAWLAEHGPSPNVYRGYVDAQGTDGPNGSAPNAQDPYDFGSK